MSDLVTFLGNDPWLFVLHSGMYFECSKCVLNTIVTMQWTNRKLGRDILNVSVQGIGVTAQIWSEKTNISVMVRTLEAVDLCTPGNRFPRILAPWVRSI